MRKVDGRLQGSTSGPCPAEEIEELLAAGFGP